MFLQERNIRERGTEMKPKPKGEIERDEDLEKFQVRLRKRTMDEIVRLADNYERHKEKEQQKKIEEFEAIANKAMETAKQAISDGLALLKKTPAGRIKAHEFLRKRDRGGRDVLQTQMCSLREKG